MSELFFRLFFILLFYVYYCGYSQNGNYLNKTNQFLTSPVGKNYQNHTDLVTFPILSSNQDSLNIPNKFSIQPIFSGMYYQGPEANQLIDTRIGGTAQFQSQYKFKINLAIYHTLQSFPEWITNEIDSFRFVPYNGIHYNKLKNLYSIFNIRGNISFYPFPYLRFYAGYDKHFIGNGYRSLFLSDESDAYPYFTILLKLWHIQYISTLSFLKDIYYEPESAIPDYKQKYGTLHYLSWNITPAVNVNLFETILWRKADSSIYNGLNIHYLNPVIFMRPVEYSQGSTDNALLGFGLNIRFYQNLLLYSQFILDEFYAREFLKKSGFFTNKHGFQLGIRDNATMIKNLKWLLEYNWVRPYTYSHYSTLQNYGNKKQPLAHPLGANFIESSGVIFYTYNNIYLSAKFSCAQFGKDTLGSNFGKNIYKNFWEIKDLYGHYILQGVKVSRYHTLIKAGYIIKPEWKLSIEAGFVWQQEKTKINPMNYTYIFAGIKTLFYNDDWFD